MPPLPVEVLYRIYQIVSTYPNCRVTDIRMELRYIYGMEHTREAILKALQQEDWCTVWQASKHGSYRFRINKEVYTPFKFYNSQGGDRK